MHINCSRGLKDAYIGYVCYYLLIIDECEEIKKRTVERVEILPPPL